MGISPSGKRSNTSHNRSLGGSIQSLSRSALADALFTSTQQRVLALLFGRPDRSFYVTELMSLARSGRGSVQRELERLARVELITRSNVGNQKHFQANHDSPLFGEICSIVAKTVGLAEPVRIALEPIAARISLALVHGSVVSRSDRSSSDIDLLLVSDELTLEDVYVALASAEEILARKINPTLYSSEEFELRKNAKNGFLTRVLESPYIVLHGAVGNE